MWAMWRKNTLTPKVQPATEHSRVSARREGEHSPFSQAM
jgi:hypothetical protein